MLLMLCLSLQLPAVTMAHSAAAFAKNSHCRLCTVVSTLCWLSLQVMLFLSLLKALNFRRERLLDVMKGTAGRTTCIVARIARSLFAVVMPLHVKNPKAADAVYRRLFTNRKQTKTAQHAHLRSNAHTWSL